MEHFQYIFPQPRTLLISENTITLGNDTFHFTIAENIIEYIDGLPKEAVAQVVLHIDEDGAFSRRFILELSNALINRGLFIYKYGFQEAEDIIAYKINIRELLADTPAQYPIKEIGVLINNKTILVTGAAGSIGSELCRLIVSIGQGIRLIMADIAESPLYELYRELELIASATQELLPIVADISDIHHYKRVFEEFKPQLIYHAAAGKQLPLMEGNAYHAMKVNLLATHNLAKLAIECKSEAFILVSTDKAVEASSVMGATKRAAEICIQSYQKEQHSTRFYAARSGNVIGSNGSVIPFFEQQIPKGWLSITHPEMMRYFVSIQRACMLLLQMGLLKDTSGLYTFEMGEQVPILQVAKLMIHLAEKTQEEVAIKYIGVRPGEKLQEKMLEDFQESLATSIAGIYKVKDEIPPASMVKSWLIWLEQNITKCSETELLSFLREICPTLPEQSVASNFQDFVKGLS